MFLPTPQLLGNNRRRGRIRGRNHDLRLHFTKSGRWRGRDKAQGQDQRNKQRGLRDVVWKDPAYLGSSQVLKTGALG